jgi:hypothetical protein
MPRKKNVVDYTAIIICGIIIIYLLSILFVFLISNVFGDSLIANEAERIVAGFENKETRIIKVLNWTRENIIHTAEWDLFFYYPFMNIRFDSNPYWIFFTRIGGCGEKAEISKFLIEKIGFDSRRVSNPGENHGWAEVYLNDTWMHADSAKAFNDPGVYERKRDEGGWGKKISYVYWIDENGARQDVTKRYTDVGSLVIKVINNDNVPVEGLRVKVKSHSLMDPTFNYPSPLVALIDITNESGEFEIELGGNNYTIIAEKDVLPFIAFIGKGNCTLIENDTCQVEIRLSENLSLTEDEEGLLISLFVFPVIAFFATYILIQYIMKHSHRVIKLFNRTIELLNRFSK